MIFYYMRTLSEVAATKTPQAIPQMHWKRITEDAVIILPSIGNLNKTIGVSRTKTA